MEETGSLAKNTTRLQSINRTILDIMSWHDLIAHLQLTANKVDKVVVYDSQGRPVAITENIETNQSEGQSLIRCLTDSCKTMSKLSVDSEMFIFLQGIDNSVIGKGVKDNERIAVACMDQDGHVILLIGHPSRNCSFIAELLKSIVLRSKGQLINLQQQNLVGEGRVNALSPSASIRSGQIPVDPGHELAT
ncbi:hypothetical protein Btru_062531 [Bulinus truncatus]|nr:hypothetical protein Btru_062531 [Bulinus truncatus]